MTSLRTDIATLLDATPAGMLAKEIAKALGRPAQAVANATLKMQQTGRIKANVDPQPGAHMAKRYFAPRHWKAVDPIKKAAKEKRALRLEFSTPVTRTVDGVKVTRIETPIDMRWQPVAVEPYFSALTPGSYPPSESAIARAWSTR